MAFGSSLIQSTEFIRRCILTACMLLIALAISPALVFAQDDGGNNGGGNGGTTDTIGTGNTSGVAVDADGVLRRMMVNDFTGQLNRQRVQESLAEIDTDIARFSKLRKVSLTRLAKLIQNSIAEGHGPTEEMKYLAGLTRIKYVFFYPETQDIVIAGPAEGWVDTVEGRVLGVETGLPVLQLQDLIVALRAFPPGERSNPLVYCSIDATDEGLMRMQEFLQSIGRQIVPGDEQFIVQGLRESLGMQMITLGGISPNTHFAQVMVEADYRMKLIGIGLETPPARIKSYVSQASFGSIASNAMCRWWFVPDYNRLRMTEDCHAMEFVGPGVKLVGEDEVVGRNGQRSSAGQQNRASRKFTRSFTDKYAQLAERSPVYGQLRNCIDMLIAAAFMQQHDLYGLAGWDLSVLGNEEIYPVETYHAPTQVASAVNSIWKGRHLATPVGGGVQIRATEALDTENLIADEKGKLQKARDEVSLSDLPADKWWWD